MNSLSTREQILFLILCIFIGLFPVLMLIGR